MQNIKHFSASEFNKLERFYRSNLINSISGYKPTNLIGTYSEKGTANLGLFSSIVHLGANPALLGYIQRPVGEFSHTYKNIKNNHYYTINHVHENFIDKAHFTSAKFNEGTSEFDVCKLTQEKLLKFNAPYVKESQIKIGMKLIQEIPIVLNKTILMIGQIEHLFISKDAILNNGSVNLNYVNDVCTSGLDTYHKVSKLKTFPYAKVDNLPKFK